MAGARPSFIRLYFTQLAVLTQKTFLLSLRNWKQSLGQTFAPVIIVFLLLGIQALSNFVLSRDAPDPIQKPLDAFPHCWDRFTGLHGESRGKDCKTVIYSPPNVQWVEDLMRQVALDNELDFEKDFQVMGKGGFGDTGFTNDNETIYNHLLNNPNTTQTAIIFTSAYAYLNKIPPQPGFLLFYNSTEANSDQSSPAFGFMQSLDRAIFHAVSGQNITLAVQSKSYPRAKTRISQYDVVASDGGVWFYIPPMVIFFILLNEIVTEKEQRLRLGMRMMGMKDSVYWIVWIIQGLCFQVLSTLILICAGSTAQFKIFTNSDFGALFIMFLAFGVAIQSVALFISALISRTKTAQTAGYAAILIGFVFQSILCGGYGILVHLLYADIRTWIKFVRWGFTLYPPFNFAKMYSDIAAKAGNIIHPEDGNVVSGPGFHWKDLYETTTISAGFLGIDDIIIPAPIQSLYFLLMDIVIYLLLTWYFDNVLPGEHGSPRPFYFPFTPQYWGIRRKGKKSIPTQDDFQERQDDEDVETERRRTINNEEEEGAIVRVVGLEKTYKKYLWASQKDLKAVGGVSFTVEKGEIFCLLGHNGAGKTTTINMLTGLFPSTKGTAYINGIDIAEDMDAVRREMGVTPQHDILWAELSAIEHLRIFARLKGFTGAEAEREIQLRLNKMGLWDVRSHRVKTFSGGMKRRLSVAIATIGGPRVIFMDEPSTGMDPVNRRHMWEMIHQLKREASIILTTHSMEEAQNLADRITIMAHGKMVCLGNALHLRNKFGKGYRLELMTEENKVEQIYREMKEICPEIQMNRCDAGNMLMDIPPEYEKQMGGLLTYLEENTVKESKEGPSGSVKEYGISISTLEEVFLEVTKRNNFQYEEEEEEEESHNSSGYQKVANSEEEMEQETSSAADSKKSRALLALLKKNLSLQKRQIGTNVCQIATPLLVMLILFILQLVIRSELGDKLQKATAVRTVPYALNGLGIPGSGFPAQPSCYQTYWYDDQVPGGIDSDFIKPRSPCRLRNGTTRPIPNFQARTSPSEMNKELYHIQEIYNSLPFGTVENPPINYMLPDGLYVFHQASYKRGEAMALNYTFSINDLPLRSYHRANGLTRVYIRDAINGLVIVEGKLAAMAQMHMKYLDLLHESGVSHKRSEETPEERFISEGSDALLMEAAKLNEEYKYSPSGELELPNFYQNPSNSKRQEKIQLQTAINLRYVQMMPFLQDNEIMKYIESIGSVLFPIALTIQLPIYLYVLVMEKGGQKELMKAHGMKTWSYLLSNYIFNMSLFIVVASFFWISGAAMSLRLFVQTNPLLLILVLLGWGNAMVAFAFFLSTFIDTTRLATVIGYVVALMGSIIGELICVVIYGATLSFSVGGRLPLAYLLLPQFAFIRALYLMNYRCTEHKSCYTGFSSVSAFFEDELGVCISFLVFDGLLYMLSAVYLEAVWPRAYGVRRHPLFFLGLGRKPAVGSRRVETMEEEDVAEERRRVAEIPSEEISSYPLIIRDLRKEYPSSGNGEKVAVQRLNLAVPRGECFGLLGENGAGKTTTISIVTGFITPTLGTATVVGHDIRSAISQVHLNIGICPQFSVLWEELTVEEHLLFYARLKGVKRSEEKRHVEKSLIRYGLLTQKDRKAKDLSGGMQRRLSVAIALVGDSQIVFLDEPTTGLDPASKRQLWRIINHAKEGRAIILTTHSMEEAELLCTRIGIVAHGKMRCIGSSLRLKNKFTKGYRLDVNFNPSDEEDVVRGMSTLFGQWTCQEVSSFRGTKGYRLYTEERLSEVFMNMVVNSKSIKITAWSLTQSGLEDVFQNIVESSKNE